MGLSDCFDALDILGFSYHAILADVSCHARPGGFDRVSLALQIPWQSPAKAHWCYAQLMQTCVPVSQKIA